MIQITLNTSLMTSVPPSNITPAECQKLVPLVKGGGGFIPDHLPWQAKTFCGEEYAMFDFRRNREDIALLHGAAWTPKGAEAVWTLMEHCYASTLKAHSPYGLVYGKHPEYADRLASSGNMDHAGCHRVGKP